MSDALRRDRNTVAFDPDRLTFAEAGSSQEAKRWADSTIRSRECRQRKKLKLVQRTIQHRADILSVGQNGIVPALGCALVPFGFAASFALWRSILIDRVMRFAL